MAPGRRGARGECDRGLLPQGLRELLGNAMERLSRLAQHLDPPVPASARPHDTAGEADAAGLRPSTAVAPSRLIFGCAPIRSFNPRDAASGPSTDVVNAAVHAALEGGIVHFDTAPLYADAEDRLGQALAASPLGSKAVVITKCGKLVRRICPNRQIAPIGPQPWAPFAVPLEERCLLPDYSAGGARKSLEESCERMGLAAGGVHTLRMHDPDSIEGAFPLATSADGLVAGLRQLRSEGTIQHVSFGMNANVEHRVVTPGTGGLEETEWTPETILKLLAAVPAGTFDSCLLAYSWNLWSQDGWSVIQACGRHGIAVHVAGTALLPARSARTQSE